MSPAIGETVSDIEIKKMFGREYPGVERSTFLLDADGVLRREWRKVKVKGQVAEVLAAVEELTGNA